MKTLFLKGMMLLLATLAVATVATANDGGDKILDANAARKLTSDRMWQSINVTGSGFYYWSWKSDGSMCLRDNEKTGKCLDTETWKLENNRLCYELTWWGESGSVKSNCFRIADEGNGRYAWLADSGLSTIKFSVVK